MCAAGTEEGLYRTSQINNRRYLGNKYKLLPFITRVVEEECGAIASVADLFAGTGAVSSAFANRVLVTNDLMYSNYCKTAAVCVKPFVDRYPYEKGDVFTADETYIKIRGVKAYVWLIMNAATRSIIGYQVSDNRGVGPCILAMRMAFRGLAKLPERFKFIADGYSAYPLAAMEFAKKLGKDFAFKVTQVIGLTNDDAVSTKHRPFKQMIERLNRTYKVSVK